jgi:REP element-mobilizing transposase RayT
VSVPHSKRPDLSGVVHVTQKLCPGLPGMRDPDTFEVLREAIRAGNECDGFRVVAFSVMSNHLHFVVEGWTTRSVSRGMQGLAIRVARALNRHWGRSGTVFLERFHAGLVRGVGAVRRLLIYVLQNARKHGLRLPRGLPDPFSSAPWFDHWKERPSLPREPSPVLPLHDSWLVAAAWGRQLSLEHVPQGRSWRAHAAAPPGAW